MEVISFVDALTVFGVSALLITGRAGAGKTSIARTVAKNMENNRNVRTCKEHLPSAHSDCLYWSMLRSRHALR